MSSGRPIVSTDLLGNYDTWCRAYDDADRAGRGMPMRATRRLFESLVQCIADHAARVRELEEAEQRRST